MFFWKKNKPKNFDKLSKHEREELVRQFLDEGNRSLEKGKHEAALESFRQLVRLEPKVPDHRRRLADCHGKLGDKKSELEARAKAATLYAEAGFLLKGIAMCKLVLAIDPSHQQTQKQLAELNELTGQAPPQFPAPNQHSQEEEEEEAEEARKDRALAEARARVERVRAAREKASAAQAAAASLSFSGGAPLAAVALQSAIPSLQAQSSVPSSLSQAQVEEDGDDDIFIAPLDEEEDNSNNAVNEERSEGAGAVEESSGLPLDRLESALKRVPLLSDLNQESFITLINEVSFRPLSKGQVLFEVGAPADAMYCVVEGEVAARLPGPFGKDLELARLGEGEFFGEIGLLADQPRQATIAATEETLLLVFERRIVSTLEKTEPDFIRILLRFVRERLVASLIATNPLFAPFAGSEAADLTRRFRFLEVKARKALVRQGSSSGGVFILLTGGARVVHSQEGTVRELGHLGPGDIFGEMSLLNRQDAIASVVTTARSYVLELPGSDFTELVMMHPALLAYVSSLALSRQANNEALLSGDSNFKEDRLPLM